MKLCYLSSSDTKTADENRKYILNLKRLGALWGFNEIHFVEKFKAIPGGSASDEMGHGSAIHQQMKRFLRVLGPFKIDILAGNSGAPSA